MDRRNFNQTILTLPFLGLSYTPHKPKCHIIRQTILEKDIIDLDKIPHMISIENQLSQICFMPLLNHSRMLIPDDNEIESFFNETQQYFKLMYIYDYKNTYHNFLYTIVEWSLMKPIYSFSGFEGDRNIKYIFRKNRKNGHIHQIAWMP